MNQQDNRRSDLQIISKDRELSTIKFSERLMYVFARYLKDYRIENNLSQAELAKQIMTTECELSNLENERALPDEISFILFLALLKKEKLTAFIHDMQNGSEVE